MIFSKNEEKYCNQVMTANQQVQELPLKLFSSSGYSTHCFKVLIDAVQKKEVEARTTKQHSRLLKHRQMQQRLSKMKILSRNQQKQLKTNQGSRKKISECQISLKIEMNKINDRKETYLKHRPNEADMVLPSIKQSSLHFQSLHKKRQEALRGSSNKWKVVLNEQQKNIHLAGSRTLRSDSSGDRDNSKHCKFQRNPRKTNQINFYTSQKRKKTIKDQFSHLKKKFFVMNRQNIKSNSNSSIQ